MATGPLILGGCVTGTVVFDAETREGAISGTPGRAGLVIAAPHSTSDVRTADIAADLGRRTGFGVVIATGSALDLYEARVREVARGPLRFLAEIHGDTRGDAAERIEIATVGVDRELAFRLRALLELIRDAHLQGSAAAPRLPVLIEPADALRDTASGAKCCGSLTLPERALHIELPKAARAEWREVYTAILADFLVQAAAYDPGR
ncbi:MAG TPA: hypothetical protein VE997_10085 [Candidatus Limnocylindria bacterium]|nr:hypothetical protein [Candidatus Limnocylindria bacterium]